MNYYAVERSTDHLAHYGVKGMKWGVRKAVLTGNEKALDRHYRKAAKKLRKLQDIGLNPGKYAAKSAAYGAAAAGTGTLAIGGTKLVGRAIKAIGRNKLLDKNVVTTTREWVPTLQEETSPGHITITRLGYFKNNHNVKNVGRDIQGSGHDVIEWGRKSTDIENPFGTLYNTEQKIVNGKVVENKVPIINPKTGKPIKSKLTLDDFAKVGAGAVTVGLAAKSIQNAYRASNAKKYRAKAVKWKNLMDENFEGTKYQGRYDVPKKRSKKRR